MATAPPWRNRIVGSEMVDPSQLLANPNNWRTHPGNQRDALRGSLSEVGWVQQVMVNVTTGHMVDGHARVEEAISRGEASIPVLYVELEPEEEALVLATLDPIGAMAQRDDAKLAELLADLEATDPGLLALLDELGGSEVKAGLTDPDDAPDLGEETHIKRGDLFALGKHRLLCGDATDAGDVARLFDGEQADIVWTDPPYGVDYVGGNHEDSPETRRAKGKLQITGDQAAQVRELVAEAFRAAPLKAGGAFYVASPSGDLQLDFMLGLQDVGLRLRQQLIWVKDAQVMSRQDYHWRHEALLYGWQDGAGHHWAGGRRQDTIWEIPRPKRSESHPTMKPVELVARSISNSSRPGENVYDPFVGSGTTIIAAEQTNRHCYAIDIDPRYVAVAIKRWEDFTGQTSVRLDG